MSIIINHCFIDGEHQSSKTAEKSNGSYWKDLPLGAIIIQEFSDNTVNLYYRICISGNNGDDFYRIGDSHFSIDHLPVSPAMKALFMLVKGQHN